MTVILDSPELLAGVCGANDGNLKVMERSLNGRIAARGNEIRFEGADEDAARFETLIADLAEAVQNGNAPSPDYVQALINVERPEGHNSRPELFKSAQIHIPRGFGNVYHRSSNQAEYVRGMRSCDICFCIGPAGTGKTYLAIAEALSLVLAPLQSERRAHNGAGVRKLVLTRPVVEAGESLGFLPGDLAQKISPYLRPLYDAMEALIPFEMIQKMEENRTIEIAPLAYMRGRSLNNCIVILDEAQNSTKEQMKMFLTRIGQGSKAVITGDDTQTDLPVSRQGQRIESGLVHAETVLKGVQGIHFARLHSGDVVRNPLVKKIIDAYDDYEALSGVTV